MESVNKQIVQIRESVEASHYTDLLKHATKLEFAAPPWVLARIHELYVPKLFLNGLLAPTDHPLAAAHLRYAEGEAHRWAKTRLPIIEIGPALISHARIASGNKHTVHACCLNVDGRDSVRHTNAAASPYIRGHHDTDFRDSVKCVAAGVSCDRICARGFENCDYQARSAIAIHSLYDVGFSELAQGMHRHGLEQIRAWMHFPLEAIHMQRYHHPKDDYIFNRYMPTDKGNTRDYYEDWETNDTPKMHKSERIFFHFGNDASFGYDHNLLTWFNYMLHGGFATPFGFNVLIEKVRHHGTQYELSITRSVGAIRLRQLLPNVMKDIVRIPDLIRMAKDGFCPNARTYFLFVSRDKIARLYHYIIAREAKEFTFRTALAYARSELRAVRLGTQVLDERWEIDCNDFMHTVCAVYLLAGIQRAQAEMTIKMLGKKTDDLLSGRGSFDRIFGTPDWWVRAIHSIKHLCGGCEVPRILSGLGSERLARLALRFFDSVETNDKLGDKNHFFTNVAYPVIDSAHIEKIDALKVAPTIEKLQRDQITLAAKQAAAQNTSVKPEKHELAQELGLRYGLFSVFGDAARANYVEQEQHDILLRELEMGHNEAAREGKDALASTLNSTREALENLPNNTLNLNRFALLTGVPGAGKTRRFFEEILPVYSTKCSSPCQGDGTPVPRDCVPFTVIVVPTRNLADELAKRVKLPNRIFTPHTALTFLENTKSIPDLVVVDEAFTFPVPLLVAYSFYTRNGVLLMGDPKQIGHINFSGLWTATTPLTKIAEYIPTEHLTKTKRCPQDIALLPFISRFYPGITSGSSVSRSINFVHGAFKPRANTQTLVFTQAMKAHYTHESAMTVHEAQGRTFDAVILHFGGSAPEKKLINSSPAHMVVALTRHTKEIFIRESEPGFITTYLNQDVKLAILAEESGTNTDYPEPALEDPEAAARVFEPEATITEVGSRYVPSGADHAAVNSVLQMIYPCEATIEEHFSVCTSALPSSNNTKGALRPDDLPVDGEYDSKSHKAYRFPTAQRVKITTSRQKTFTARTLLERYAKETINLKGKECKNESKRLFGFLKDNINYTARPEWQSEVYLEAIEKYQAKGHDVSDLQDIDCWTDQGASKVSFQIKSQQKPDTGFNPLQKDKAGQGIAAWSKTLNFTMIVWTRMLERVLTHQASRSFHFVSRYTDHEVLCLLDTIQQNHKNANLEYFEGDWTEFDSSQNNVEHALFCLQLEAIGCPKGLVRKFRSMMTSRMVSGPLGSLLVENKKDSGRVDTLVGNSTFNAAVVLSLVEGTVHHTLWKGDDSLIIGEKLFLNPKRSNYLEKECGYKIKAAVGPSGDFVSFLINCNGAAINIPKLAAKVISRVYKNEEDFEAYQTAVKDALKPARETTTAARMCQVNSAHHRRDRDDIDLLLSFLTRFARGEIGFKNLVEFEMTMLVFGAKDDKGQR